MTGFTPWRLATRGLQGHRRSHAAVAAGVALATAVLVGALVVGESVRGSLRGLVIERLGWIDSAVVPGRSFRVELADEARAKPIIVLPVTLGRRVQGKAYTASQVTLIGCGSDFWSPDNDPDDLWIFGVGEDSVALTDPIARELGIEPHGCLEGADGDLDYVVARLATDAPVPADSPLGDKANTVVSKRLFVPFTIPPKSLGNFSLNPTQGTPRNVFTTLDVAQKLLDAGNSCNALVAAGAISVEPAIEDYGLAITEVDTGRHQLDPDELVLPAVVVEAVERAWEGLPRVAAQTYLANTIRVGDKSIPYSTVTGVAGDATLMPCEALADDQIALNRWAADDLGAEVGDQVTLTYYEPESTHGVLREAAPVTFTLAEIVELKNQGGTPTTANDRRWTPELEGVTDAESINNWDLPFELVEPIRQTDEDYWDEYNTTPKAFVSLATAQRLWGARWGDTSLIRVNGQGATRQELAERLREAIDPADLGFSPRPVKQEQLEAASGSTPFDVLFLLFSMFLIGSALLLIVLLVWLAIDARRRELGVLGAVGFDRRALRRALLRELAPVAAIGAVIGAVAGVAYAAGLLYLLRTVWIDAIGEPFLRLHAGAIAVVGGAVGAWLVAMSTIAWAVWRATRERPNTLLAGTQSNAVASAPGWRFVGALIGGAAATIALAASGRGMQGEAAAGVFFGAGALALATLIGLIYYLAAARRPSAANLSLGSLAGLNAIRRPGRSLLTIGLVAAASFLLLATSAFRLPPTESGTGGFDLVCQSDQPLHYDLATEDGRWELGFGSKQEAAMKGATVFSFRVQPGEDASCRNLYQTTQPRVLGVSERFIDVANETDAPFQFAPSRYNLNGWGVLGPGDRDASDPIPIVLDFNTAMYSLKLYGGVGSTFTIRDEVGEEVTVEVAGLLKNSVLQGDLLMGEADFLRLFPSASGSRFFLIDTDEPARVTATLEDTLSDYGLDAADAKERLAGFLSVQNTYLSTFQSLGGLGLALGAIGLAIAQFRNLAERRGELALLRAAGFPKARLRRLVLGENLALLACGLAVGALAATATLAPLAAAQETRPPWLTAIALVGATVGIGLLAGRIAATSALRAPVTAALRGE